MARPRIVVAHPEALVLEGLVATLRGANTAAHVEPVQAADQLLENCARQDVDVAVIGADVAGVSAVGLCTELTRHGAAPVVLTRVEAADHVELLEAGAQGLVMVTDGLETLMNAVQTVLDGNVFVPPHLLGAVLRGLITQRRQTAAQPSPIDGLSPREREVLSLLARGSDQRDVARALGISPNTAKTHISRVVRKLEVRSRIEAAALAVAHGVDGL